MRPPKCPARAQYLERVALEAILKERAHTPAEDARLGVLLGWEARRLRYAPERIVHLEAELAFLRERVREAQQVALSTQRTLPLVFMVRNAG